MSTAADRADAARLDAWLARLLDAPLDGRAAVLGACAAESATLGEALRELADLASRPAPGLEAGALGAEVWQRVLATADLPEAPALEAGIRVGRWRVVGEVGRGGMGTVYLVERADGTFDQRAALKLVRTDLAGVSTRRFETETAILAALTHPGIARLIDGGRTADDLPFFVMEYVEGLPIDRHADEQCLTIDARLDLFLHVCRVIEHAHRHLVVHGDVKPSNIVVTDEGTVKLLDFGIAAVVTGSGEAPAPEAAWVLTPAYASPEQVRGEPLTTASDVYQLGLLLFELLTGRRAQSPAGASAAALTLAVCATTLPRPSEAVAREPSAEDARRRGTSVRALASRLRGDLDALVARAVRKAPEDRYGSVGELIDDVRRWQQLRPLSARGSAPAYRLAKFVRRHRVAFSVTALVVAVAAWLVPALAGERLRAREEARRAQQIERVLGGLFPLGDARSSRTPTARDYADHAQALVRRDLAGHPASQGRLMTMFGRTYVALGLYEDADKVLGDAVGLLRQTADPESLEVAEAVVSRAESLHYLGRYEQAADAFRRALSLRRARLGDDHPLVVSTRLAFGDLRHTQGALREAEHVLREGIAALDAHPDQRHALARARRDLANVLRDRGALEESDALYREALAGFEAISSDHDVQYSFSNLEYARLLVLTGRHEEAEQRLVRHLELLRRTFDGDHPLTGTAHQQLGVLRTAQGRLAEADAHLNTSAEVLGTWLGAGHPMVARNEALRAELARRQGRPEEARRAADRALTHFERLGLAGHPRALEACRTWGEVQVGAGLGATALPRLSRCVADAERELVAGDARTRRLRELLAQATRHGPAS